MFGKLNLTVGALNSYHKNVRLTASVALSSRGLGHSPFTAATRVRIPSGSLVFSTKISKR